MPSGGLNKKNLINQVFGGLTVVSQAESSKRGLACWECTCECGNSYITTGYYLTQGRKKSCGCRNSRSYGKSNHRWSGYENISGAYWHRIKKGSAQRGIDLQVSIRDIWEVFEEQHGRCALTGIEISLCDSDTKRRKNLIDQTASLDRIDSSKGYTKDNIQWVHKTINRIKMDMNDQEFISWCTLVANHKNRTS
jgi:hypothetical protein